MAGRKNAHGFLVAVFLLAAVTFPTGCGSSSKGPSYGSPEGRKIAERVSELSDTNDLKKLAALFAKGVAPKPADLKRFRDYYFDVVGNPSVSGDAATAKITARDHLSGKEAGPLDWSFVKEGEEWKLKTAPLP